MRIKWFSLVRVTGLLLVLLYHFFQKAFPGGFIGVDIFFTFSGFLITALLIDEFARKQGIDYLAFLKRRFYRIVPPCLYGLGRDALYLYGPTGLRGWYWDSDCGGLWFCDQFL